MAGIDPVNRRPLSAALIHHYFARRTVTHNRFVEAALSCGYVALGCQQEVDGFTPLVDSEVEIFQDAFDLDVRFIHPSARADWAFVPASHLFDKRQKANCPAIDQ